MTPPDPQGAETPDFGVTFKCEAKPEHVHNHPLFDLHDETLAMLAHDEKTIRDVLDDGILDAPEVLSSRRQLELTAYAAECVREVAALRAENATLREKAEVLVAIVRDLVDPQGFRARLDNGATFVTPEEIAGLRQALAAYHAARAGRTDA